MAIPTPKTTFAVAALVAAGLAAPAFATDSLDPPQIPPAGGFGDNHQIMKLVPAVSEAVTGAVSFNTKNGSFKIGVTIPIGGSLLPDANAAAGTLATPTPTPPIPVMVTVGSNSCQLAITDIFWRYDKNNTVVADYRFIVQLSKNGSNVRYGLGSCTPDWAMPASEDLITVSVGATTPTPTPTPTPILTGKLPTFAPPATPTTPTGGSSGNNGGDRGDHDHGGGGKH
jgi:hypothetical protein